ncbi:MAG: DUF4159 domain-containing protein [Planctomyces sp.]|nr:DUF4159 domain-containing protein [Planctomyces sp.]
MSGRLHNAGRTVLALALCLFAGRAQAIDDAQLRARVLQSIERAQQFIISQQAGDGSWAAAGAAFGFQHGTTSLAVLALLNTGMSPEDPPVAAGLRYLRSIDDYEESSSHVTYEMALMLQAFAAVKGGRDRGRMLKLATILEEYQRPAGGWRYKRQGNDWDNSVSQFVLLGLREAAMSGVPVDRDVWRKSQDLWLKHQMGPPDAPSGAGWNYHDQSNEPPSGGMTVAGISSLIITSTMLQDDSDVTADGRINCCAPRDDRVQRSIDAGGRWLGSNFRVASNPGKSSWTLYYLYGLERAGRFSGLRQFGQHDWYRAGAEYLVDQQDPRTGKWQSRDGFSNMPVVDTCFGLLFLSKGLAPVVVNKLKYGPRDPGTGEPLSPDWNRHPRDAANLVDSITTRDRWPQFLNWQVVDLEQAAKSEGVSALLQAPVQYLSGSDRPDAIQGPQLELLRECLMQGGFLFAVQNCENSDFDQGFRDLVTRMFPEGEFQLRRLPSTHDVYRSETVFTAQNAPELWGVDFGCRTAIIYAPYDHACRWQKWARFDPPQRHAEVKRQVNRSIDLGVNIIAYATNRELHDKLQAPPELAGIDDDPTQRGKLAIARLRHTGGWDAAPNALRHLNSALESTGFQIAGRSPNIPATDPSLFDFPIVYMHGRTNFAMTQDEIDSLRTYLDNGGVLFADACCGAAQFDASFREMIERMYGKPLELIPPTHELFKMPLGHDLQQVTRRVPSTDLKDALETREVVGPPILEGIAVNGRYVVLYSKYDLSCALEQQNTLACAGYSRADAAKIAMNMVIYALVQ